MRIETYVWGDAMGRPTKFNPERAAAIVKSLRGGASRKDAAEAAGVSYNTFLSWIARGEKARSGEFLEFLGEVSRAEALVAEEMAESVVAAANGYQATTVKRTIKPDGSIEEETKVELVRDWRAGAAWLRMRRRDEWSERTEVTGADGGPVEVADARDTLQRRLAGLAARSGAGEVRQESEPAGGGGPAV